MANHQPRYYVGIAKCGCVVAWRENVIGFEKGTAKKLRAYVLNKLRVEPRDTNTGFGHTCGKVG